MDAVPPTELAAHAELLESFINDIPGCAVCMLDTSGHVRSWNASAEHVYGYSPPEIIGRHFSVLCSGENGAAEQPWPALDRATQDGISRDEGSMARKDRTRFRAALTIRALENPDGTPRGFAALTQDITEHATTGPRQAGVMTYRAAYENSLDAILLVRPDDGTVQAANPAACTLFGLSERELTSLRREQVFDMTDARVARALARSGAGDEASAEVTFIRKGGARFEGRFASREFTDETGQQMACISLHDITEQRQVEEALRQTEERFRLLYENAPLGIIQIDSDARVTSANQMFIEMAGYRPDEAIGLDTDALSLPDERAAAGSVMDDLMSGRSSGDKSDGERPLVRKDGSSVWVRRTFRMIRDAQGKPQWGIGILEDISARRRSDEASRYNEEKFRAMFDHAPLGLARGDLHGRFVETNSTLADMLGYAKDEIERLTTADLTHPSDVERSLSNLHKLATGETDSYVQEKRYIRKDRSFVWVNVTASLVPIPGQPQHVVLAVEDITARKKVEEDLKRAMEVSYHQATHDMLTGVANRASFTDHLAQALAYAKRDGHVVALHVLDLDRFKSINDTMGHHIGDLLLKDVAKRIKANVRPTDLVARLGGDEFVVVQGHLLESAAAGVLAQRLVKDLTRKYVLEGQDVQSGASIGIALCPSDADNGDDLIKYADLALYDAKRRGRFNSQFYRKELGAAFRRAQKKEQQLELALQNHELSLDYQPQFDVNSGRVTGIEALLRWRHPTKGKLQAGEFIRDLETARLMPRVGQWILQTACEQCRQWRDAGLTAPLTLNLSSLQLRDPRLPQALKQVLAETGLPPSSLQLEIRESVLWDPRFSTSVLNNMKESGLRLALDDFAAEMTALLTLERFPLDVVKPGQELVRKAPDREREATIMAAIVALAHQKRIAVCADGVETAVQLAAAKEQGCDSAQGHFLSVPLEADAMTRLLERDVAQC